jgi:D-inositol-3-phosphate glycosyltransferase
MLCGVSLHPHPGAGVMMRLALISEHASPLAAVGSVDGGGQNIYVAQLARHLAAIGHWVDVFTRRDREYLEPIVECGPRVRVIHVPAGPACHIAKEDLLPTMEEFTRFLCRFVGRQSQRYDVLHANFFMSGLAAQRAAQRFGIPLVVTFHALGQVRRQHQGASDRFPERRLEIESMLVREADRIIAECPQDHADLVNLYGADPAKLDVIPCGFDPGELAHIERHEARQVLDWDPERFTLLQLGRLVPRKGVANVLRGVDKLVRVHGVDAQLYVVGGDNEGDPGRESSPELQRLRALACELGVEARVQFLGRRDREEIPYLYRASDVFVTTPWYEPFGITPVEAMGCGVPVVGSAVGGIRTTVVDGVTGRLVPPEDPDTLALVLAELAGNAELRANYGRAGHMRAHTSFTWQHVTRRLLGTYRKVTGRPSRDATRNVSELRSLGEAATNDLRAVAP